MEKDFYLVTSISTTGQLAVPAVFTDKELAVDTLDVLQEKGSRRYMLLARDEVNGDRPPEEIAEDILMDEALRGRG